MRENKIEKKRQRTTDTTNDWTKKGRRVRKLDEIWVVDDEEGKKRRDEQKIFGTEKVGRKQ